ncbi:hypothetical protein IP91_01957 [Pseudoduganella lurida]|uniref:DUF3828 domain-containing protein n=1 Tax=Pseudoduganella lurida TaxID=1036180 RepID=A0A562RCJ8_9BURK|nr:hypothetical protein [Pseudoduganella lurida]TWI66146.1 hypothetical protein IP91_01957 [Pseudoduganella lurida]
MKARPASRLALGLSVLTLALLSACGSDNDPPRASNTSIDSFVADYNRGLASVSNMNAATFADLVDDSFLDAGYNKAQLLSNVKADAAALADASNEIPADQVFPLLTIKDAAVSNCDDSTGICTLTATYVNPDKDATSAPMTVQVRFQDGRFRLYGDQKSA